MNTSSNPCRLPLMETMEPRQFLSAGQLDPSFGTAGIAQINNGLAGASAVSLQSDGKIVVNAEHDVSDGTITRIGQDSTQVRFNADGTIDTSFGNGGISGVSIGGSGPVTVGKDDNALDHVGTTLALADGKFLFLGSRLITEAGGHQVVSRYNADGSLDSSFGDQGTTTLTWTSMAVAPGTAVWVGGGPTEMLLQNDGKILVTRSTGVGAASDLQIVRLTSDGQLDQGFGDHGVVTIAGAGEPGGMVLQADGKIVVAAQPYEKDSDTTFSHPYSTDLVRLNADGSLDGTFGTGGQNIQSLGGGIGYVHQLILDANGKILLLGDLNGNGGYIARYNADGSLDTTFGNQGKQLLDNQTNSMLMDDEGRIVTLGIKSVDSGKREAVFSQRVEADGGLDTGYGVNGVATIDLAGETFYAGAFALTSDGGVIIAGSVSEPQSFGRPPSNPNPDLVLVKLQGGDDAQDGVERAVAVGKPPRSPKRIAMELAAQASHRSPKRIAMDLASHRSPKRIAMELAAEASHRSPKRIAMELAAQTETITFDLQSPGHRSPKRIAMEMAARTFSTTKIG
jgi:uncharacterized delta-60 repeat protein